jgi:NADPH:quinone reductase-like Zn-dependent oxidoreductase
MKAIQIYSYGKPEKLTLVDLPIPTIKPTELLIQNKVAGINPFDCMVRNGSMWFMEGFRFPKILGGESSGVVVKIGSAITQYRVGQRVVVFTGRKNAYAEYLAVTEASLSSLPDNMSFNEGAALPIAGCTAYDALYLLADIKPQQWVLVYGAYGSVGSFAVQLAKLAGAFVVGVCSTPNLTSVKALGADEVVDYTTTDFRTLLLKYDIIFDTPSVLNFSGLKEVMNDPGVYIATLPTPSRMASQLLTSTKSKKLKVVFANPTSEKITNLSTLVNEGRMKVILDKEYPIEQISAAHHHSETKRAKGKITVRF